MYGILHRLIIKSVVGCDCTSTRVDNCSKIIKKSISNVLGFEPSVFATLVCLPFGNLNLKHRYPKIGVTTRSGLAVLKGLPVLGSHPHFSTTKLEKSGSEKLPHSFPAPLRAIFLVNSLVCNSSDFTISTSV